MITLPVYSSDLPEAGSNVDIPQSSCVIEPDSKIE